MAKAKAIKEKAAIEFRQVNVTYPGSHGRAVDEVSFSVPQGKIVSLLGPNGSGKTTLIRALLGLVPYQGEILIFGQPVEKSYEMIGFLPQRYSFDPTFPIKVKEFVRLPLISCQKRVCWRENWGLKILKEIKAGHLYEKPLTALSGGELQRVLLARAFVHKPKLLILDEPEAGIDVGGEQTLYELLTDLVKKEGLTVLTASHELDVVFEFTDQVVCLNRKLICKGKPKEVLNQSTFMKMYGKHISFYAHDD